MVGIGDSPRFSGSRSHGQVAPDHFVLLLPVPGRSDPLRAVHEGGLGDPSPAARALPRRDLRHLPGHPGLSRMYKAPPPAVSSGEFYETGPGRARAPPAGPRPAFSAFLPVF